MSPFLLAHASLHQGVTVALLLALVAGGVALRRRGSRRAGRGLIGSAVGTGLVLVVFCAHAVSSAGAPRTAILVADKKAQLADGRLFAATRWGLLDRDHVAVADEHIAVVSRHLRDPALRRDPVVLEVVCGTLSGTWDVRREYRLRRPELLTERDIPDAARALALQMAFDVEREQERAPAWTGLRMSAFQFEDLASSLHAAIGERSVQKGDDARLWALVEQPRRAYVLPGEASLAERAAYERVRAAHALWSRVDGELESPFAVDSAREARARAVDVDRRGPPGIALRAAPLRRVAHRPAF